MSKSLRTLAFLVAVCCLTWVGVLWWWQRTDRAIEVQDVAIYLGLLPLVFMLVVLAMRWAWKSAGARQALLAGMPTSANGGSTSSVVSVEGGDERARHAVVQLVQVAVLCTVGDQVSDLLESVADGKPLPQPDTGLRNEAGLPVLSARIPDAFLQSAMTRLMLEDLLSQLQRQTEWHSQELADDVVRALSALRQPLLSQCEWLENLIQIETETRLRREGGAEQAQTQQRPSLQILLGWPAHWSRFDQDLARLWVEQQLAAPENDLLASFALSSQVLAGNGEDLWLQADKLNHSGQRSDWLLVAACHSDLTTARVEDLASKQRLYDPTNKPTGCIPGEAAVAMLMAPAKWKAPDELDVTSVILHRPALLRRNKPVEARGKIDHDELDQAIAQALFAAKVEATQVPLLMCDADQHSARATELYGATLAALPHIDPLDDLRVLGKITGYTGVASLPMVIAGAYEWVNSTRKTVLALGMADSHLRMAVVLKPQPKKIPDEAHA